MTQLSPENARFIDGVVATGRFTSQRDAMDEAVRLLRRELDANGQPPADAMTASAWCERFERWAASHAHLSHEADDTRESIYAGQGE